MRAELDDTDYADLRHRMVHDQLRTRHIADEQVLAAMEKVPRHMFVPAVHRRGAYSDGPLPIGLRQTISQPYMVARMTELLHPKGTDRVLEIGTGSGYQTAVLAEIVGSVVTIERHAELARQAEALLCRLGYKNVTVIVGDGSLGYADASPFHGIIVTAAAPHVPQCLRDQLGPAGRMVIPVTAGFNQDLRLIERLSDPAACAREASGPEQAPLGEQLPGAVAREDLGSRFRETSVLGCVFVPLIGEEGYRE